MTSIYTKHNENNIAHVIMGLTCIYLVRANFEDNGTFNRFNVI